MSLKQVKNRVKSMFPFGVETFEVVFNSLWSVLCPSRKVGRMIGVLGETITNLRKSLDVHVTILDDEVGDDERLIIIWLLDGSHRGCG